MAYAPEDEDYGYAIAAVDNAARVLLMLISHPSVRAADVARELGVARSTAHRMVSTLQRARLLRRDPDKPYGPAPALGELGHAVLGVRDIGSEIEPTLSRLATATGETVHFLIRYSDEVQFVAVAESSQVIRPTSRVGSRLPAHVTAAGRAILATLGEAQLLDLYPDERLPAGGTARAISRRSALIRDLAEVREAGFAVNIGESETGLVAVAAVVPRPLGLTPQLSNRDIAHRNRALAPDGDRSHEVSSSLE